MSNFLISGMGDYSKQLFLRLTDTLSMVETNKPLCVKFPQTHDLECAPFLWEKDPQISAADQLIINDIKVAPDTSACDQLPAIMMVDGTSIDQASRRFAPYPADYLPPIQRDTFAYDSDTPLKADEVDRRHFWNLLMVVIPEVSGNTEINIQAINSPHRILDLGCGYGLAALALQHYFGMSTYEQFNRDAHYIGVDIDSSIIDSAHALHEGQPDVDFFTADATDLRTQPWAQDAFDTVVIRHPEVFTRHSQGRISETWYKIFKTAVMQLQVGGLLVVTAHRCSEFQGADAALEKLGLTKLYAAQNPFTPIINVHYGFDPALYLRDRYIAVYTKEPIAPSHESMDPPQISTDSIHARQPDGASYWVWNISGLDMLLYLEPATQRTLILSDSRLTSADRVQLASDGTSTFVLAASEKHTDLYKVDWETSTLVSLKEAPKKQDFRFCYRGHCDEPLEVRTLGFIIIDETQQLAGVVGVRNSNDHAFRSIFPLR